MNQAILFNDDLMFDKAQGAWTFTAIVSGQLMSIFFHSIELKHLATIDNCTKYDLEEVAELWLEKNEPEGSVIHIHLNK